MIKRYIFWILLFYFISKEGNSQSLTNTVHKTQAAAEKKNDLWCYNCDTMEDGELCIDLLTNHSTLMKKCKDDEFVCMVKRVSYTTSNENSTSSPKMWSLERKCSVNCEPGCITIGERTKLSACTSCCEKSLCNIGSDASSIFDRMFKIAKVIKILVVTYLSGLFVICVFL